MGLLPTYETAGVVAPVLLVAVLPRDEFMAWGWRLPFIASIVLVAVALRLRWNVEETPEFQELKASDGTNKAPVVELFRQQSRAGHRRMHLSGGQRGFFILTTFMISYVARVLGLPSTVILTAMTIGAVVQMVVTVLAGRLADRFGAARVGIIGYSIFIALAFPIFWLVDSKDTGLIILAMVLAFGSCAITNAIIGALIDRLFPAQVKYTGMGLSANLSAVVAGFMPALATVFLTFSGNASWGRPRC